MATGWVTACRILRPGPSSWNRSTAVCGFVRSLTGPAAVGTRRPFTFCRRSPIEEAARSATRASRAGWAATSTPSEANAAPRARAAAHGAADDSRDLHEVDGGGRGGALALHLRRGRGRGRGGDGRRPGRGRGDREHSG